MLLFKKHERLSEERGQRHNSVRGQKSIRGDEAGERRGAPDVRGSILKDQQQINVTALFICREVLMTGPSLSDLPSFLTDVEDLYLMRRTGAQHTVEAGQGSTVTTVA